MNFHHFYIFLLQDHGNNPPESHLNLNNKSSFKDFLVLQNSAQMGHPQA